LHIYPTYIYNLHTPISRTKSHFQYKKTVQPGISIGTGIGIAAADSIRYRAPARYRSNPIGRISLFWSVALQGHPKQLNEGDHDWLIQTQVS